MFNARIFSWSIEIWIVFHYLAQNMPCSLMHKQNVSLSGIIPLDILRYFWKGWKITIQFYKLQFFIRAVFHIYAFMTVIQIQLLKLVWFWNLLFELLKELSNSSKLYFALYKLVCCQVFVPFCFSLTLLPDIAAYMNGISCRGDDLSQKLF